MVYTHQDIQEFDKQIKELLDKGLIRNSKSPYNSITFIVWDYFEEKREKVTMVISYENLTDNTVIDGYDILTVVFNRIQEASWFSQKDCKRGY